MKNQFYSHIIHIESIHTALSDLDLTPQEHEDLIIILHSNIHHTVIDIVLSHLSPEDKKTALSHMTKKNHDELWKLLTTKIDKVEEKIQSAVSELVKNLHTDITEAKKKG